MKISFKNALLEGLILFYSNMGNFACFWKKVAQSIKLKMLFLCQSTEQPSLLYACPVIPVSGCCNPLAPVFCVSYCNVMMASLIAYTRHWNARKCVFNAYFCHLVGFEVTLYFIFSHFAWLLCQNKWGNAGRVRGQTLNVHTACCWLSFSCFIVDREFLGN